jgi:hypothetical protein
MFIWFCIKMAIFDTVYAFVLFVESLVVAMLLALLLRPILSKYKERPKWWWLFIGTLRSPLVAIQGLIVGSAVTISLRNLPNSWSVLWYIVGFACSVPYHFIHSEEEEGEREGGGKVIPMLAAEIAYIVVCIWPFLNFWRFTQVGEWLAVGP